MSSPTRNGRHLGVNLREGNYLTGKAGKPEEVSKGAATVFRGNPSGSRQKMHFNAALLLAG